MDERRLAELFREAADDAPPSSFGADDVAAASRQTAARRRARIAGGSLLSVGVLLGGLTVGGVLAGSPEEAPAPQPVEPPFPGPSPQAAPRQAVPGGLADGVAEPGAGSIAGGCGPAAPEVAAALVAELPPAAGRPPFPVPEQCPPGARGAAVGVADGPVTGSVFVLVGPAGALPRDGERADGARVARAADDEGTAVLVISVPTASAEVAPFSAELPDLARRLANRL